MTDAHCHVSCAEASVRELLVGRDFFGVHPWEAIPAAASKLGTDPAEVLENLRETLLAQPQAGVGEIGLDRLRARDIPPSMREVFEVQLRLAVELGRPVVLHGAKCWGQVVATVESAAARGAGRFLFHGFSRSGGLMPRIVALGGFVSVGPAVLNDRAVNYRALVKEIPLGRLLVETDRTEANAAECPSVRAVLAEVAALRGLPAAELEKVTDENAERFMHPRHPA